jgi:shikimate kinase
MLIFLTGFMCSGKTTDGKAIAQSLNIPFLDLDEELEKRSGMSIWTFIETRGITEFRQLETEILFQTRQFLHSKLIEAPHHTNKPEAIIATGGGSILKQENRDFLQQTDHKVIWLDLPFPLLLERIRANKRPLLQGLTDTEIYNLYLERVPMYQSVCHQRITSFPILEQLQSICSVINLQSS